MGLFDKLTGRKPAPPPAKPPLSLGLQTVRVLHPLPGLVPGDALAAEINRQWIAFQRSHNPASWQGFLDHLRAQIAKANTDIQTTRREIANTDPNTSS